MAAVEPTHALILLGPGGVERNTTPPTGALADSGWQFQTFAGLASTVVGPRHVLSARHLNSSTNSPVIFDGLAYQVVEVTDVPASDLRVLRVAGRFSRWAPLYARTDEPGKAAVLFGRGVTRGEEVFMDSLFGPELRGWRWGAADFRPRWGTNVIEEVFAPGELSEGALLAARFDEGAGDDEATVTGGDSGSGLFIRDQAGVWKLAGVGFAVESQFNTVPEGDGFSASLFDRRGFYQRDSGGLWQRVPNSATPGTGLFYTRVSTYAAQVEAVLAASAGPPAESVPRLLSSAEPAGPFTEHPAYAVNATDRQITALPGAGQKFFQLEGVATVRLVEVAAGWLKLEY
jgi:hypothetical protein